MIKINLLPPHILEGRRIKIVAVLMGLLVLATALVMAGWIWFAPAPVQSLSSQLTAAQEKLTEVTEEAEQVTDLESQVAAEQNRYKSKATWVDTVHQADAKPAQWVRWFQRVNRYIPNEVVLNGLPLPSGTTLNLSGSTRDLRAAMRWYLNMLRCEMIDPGVAPTDAVRFNPNVQRFDTPMAAGVNPRMATTVNLAIALNPAYLDFMIPIAPPVGMGTAGGGRGGGRMGGGRSGGGSRGGGMRGGRRG